jgi:putative transposase
MAKPYSLGLCERVVVRVVAGDPVRLVARRFGVSASSVVKWSQRFRATGSAAAGKMGGMRPKLLVGQHRGWLLDRIVRADFTLRGLVAELAERGVKVDDRTVWELRPRRTLEFQGTWTRIGHLLNAFTKDECGRYLVNAGNASI